MTGTPIWIEPEASALAALDLMIDHGIRHLPVLDAERRVCGILSFDDLRAAFPMPLSLRNPPSVSERTGLPDPAVGEVMTYAPLTVRCDTPLEEAAERMAEHRIGCLPVVDESGRLEGILSETDLLYALATALSGERRRVQRDRPLDVADWLERERRELVVQLGAYERHEQELTSTRRETPLDQAEMGSLADDARLTEGLADLASRRLRAIEHALERRARGELTRCETCGGAIPEARLRALPSATHCIRCARAAEERA